MRLIDADVLSQKWQNVLDQKANEKDSIAYRTFELFMDRLKYEPTIEAEPVRHARYIPDMNYRTLGNCGLCGGDVTFIQNYCPNCGAKMDGGAE